MIENPVPDVMLREECGEGLSSAASVSFVLHGEGDQEQGLLWGGGGGRGCFTKSDHFH